VPTICDVTIYNNGNYYAPLALAEKSLIFCSHSAGLHVSSVITQSIQ